MPLQTEGFDADTGLAFARGIWIPSSHSKETIEILPRLKKEEESAQLIGFWLINELFRSREWGSETQTMNISINYEKYYALHNIPPCFKKEKEPKEIEQEALFSIALDFSKIEKVKSIYVQKYREELQIQILLAITNFDSSLMDVLLDKEYDIRKRYSGIIFEFFYPPAGISYKDDFIHPHAQCIYSK